MIDNREQKIIDFINKTGACSSKEVFDSVDISVSYATLKRILTNLKSNNYLISTGKGKGTKYLLSPTLELIQPIDIEKYYQKEIDEREIRENFNSQIITNVLSEYNAFTKNELDNLSKLQKEYKANIAELSENEYKKELERLAIDLSWKSSQIEGNTYSLLETERLLKEKETASGKTKEEAIML
ncbi:MAG: cell filamentation protein Fic, partial [Bacteroidota bacterium]|nr:cell filamentation protein Fic [Bacteroidota bacterium]